MNENTDVARLGAFLLETSVDVGQHASRYVARDRSSAPGDASIEVRALHALTPALRRRLRVLVTLEHAGLLPILSLQLDGPEPHITVRVASRSWRDEPPSTPAAVRAALYTLADALATAHRMGVVHGALEPTHVLCGPRGWWLDLSGTDPRPAPPRAPEVVGSAVPTPAADVWAVGTLLAACTRVGKDVELDEVLASMHATDPEARPTFDELLSRLDHTRHLAPVLDPAPDAPDIPARLGPYALLEKLGAGGMGAVFRARSRSGTDDVALKVMLPEHGRDRVAVARFRREARVLAQLSTPHIARFIGAQRDGDFEYLVMEFVEGRSAMWLLQKRGAFPIPAGLAIACDVARALVEVHALDLVHRDVKPSNILIAADSDPAVSPRAKLCDFGIVRAGAGEEAEALTELGRPGTPSFMSPEQVLGHAVGPASDVYALAATLYALIVGEPPYTGPSALVLAAHVQDPVPDVRDKKPEATARLAATITRALAKSPTDRHATVLELLEELEAARSGEASTVAALPQPINLTGEPVTYDFHWELDSLPEELWPHVSNTERLNRAIGLDDVAWELRQEGDERLRIGSFRSAGMRLEWKENPFEWVAPHRLGVVREYRSGPFLWMRSVVDLARGRERGGTRLTHRIEILPRNLLGRAAAGVEIGLRLKRSLDATYRRIDRACTAARASGVVGIDPFEAPGAMPARARAQLREAMVRTAALGGHASVIAALEEWIVGAPPQAVGRVRPYAWADERRLARRATLETFLCAASAGALALAWDILCPTCRIASDLRTSLRALEEHGRCEACDLDFQLDLARSVELVFRVHPELRAPDEGVYCIGGPAHSPHVVAQVRLERGKRFTLEAKLDEGAYVLRGRDLPASYPLVVREGAALSRWALSLRDEPARDVPRSIAPGPVSVAMVNDLDRDVVVRLERSAERADVVTAADAAASSLFRRLFPDEVLAPHELIGISHVSLLLAEAPDLLHRYQTIDDRHVHAELVVLQQAVTDAAEREGGAIVKLQLQGVLAVFTDPAAATRAAIALVQAMRGTVKVAVHCGDAILTTINQRLDYFGRTVHATSQLLDQTEAGELVVSDDVQRSSRDAVDALRAAPLDIAAIVQRTTIGLRYRLR